MARRPGAKGEPMHECEYCGEARCVKRACLDALLSNAAYFDAEIKYRQAMAEADKARKELDERETAMRELAVRMKELLRGRSQP